MEELNINDSNLSRIRAYLEYRDKVQVNPGTLKDSGYIMTLEQGRFEMKGVIQHMYELSCGTRLRKIISKLSQPLYAWN